ncbi:Putative hydroxypyruvate isomerase YgbM [Pseudoruegeria aquimaris]|uniref:Putative hydroxypyruvate isomerase YgbM n=1 Tax=Pseudoruegeria aquimaris TaxID=393663 RepID=A0A1Y5RP09_9RHOB|nr:TIM barrel protein [Pseudoruegeria aquimaris]SLN19329.1 Putative hydroxypyruvate isomerase YgbM [Pseudoruegeria aquimaris]
MTRFSANLGFLWADRPLPEAIRAAHAAGFAAVECHWPYDEDRGAIAAALADTGLPMLGLNTRRGDVAGGENGLSALPGRAPDARAAIDEALDWAVGLGVPNIHVMAGFAAGPAAEAAFRDSLAYACAQAAPHGVTILIEPLNGYDAPGYFLNSATQAAALIDDLGLANLKLMFDCYHVQLTEGDLTHRLAALKPIIGHIQFAGVPARGRPDEGEVNYRHVFAQIAAMGYTAPLGAEYKPGGDTDATLGWMQDLAIKG